MSSNWYHGTANRRESGSLIEPNASINEALKINRVSYHAPMALKVEGNRVCKSKRSNCRPGDKRSTCLMTSKVAQYAESVPSSSSTLCQHSNAGLYIEDCQRYGTSEEESAITIASSDKAAYGSNKGDLRAAEFSSKTYHKSFPKDSTMSPLDLSSDWVTRLSKSNIDDNTFTPSETNVFKDIDPILFDNLLLFNSRKDLQFGSQPLRATSVLGSYKRSTLKVIQSPCDNYQAAKMKKFVSLDNQIVYKPIGLSSSKHNR